MKKKIIFVVNDEGFFISHRLGIAKKAIEAGFEVHVATAQTSNSNPMGSLGIIVHPLFLQRSSLSLLSNIRTFIEISRLFLRLRPDLVHLITIKPVILGGLAARIFAVPHIVVAITGLGYVFTSSGFFASVRKMVVKALYKVALKNDKVNFIFQNKEDQKVVCNLLKKKIEDTALIQGSGVDLDVFRFNPLALQKPIVMLPARLLFDKGVNEFVEAAKIIKDKDENVRFVLVGDIDPENPSSVSEKQLKDWLSKSFVEWWGFQKKMEEIIPKAYMIVLPSYREGMPKVLLEAAACGRAIVTTDIPGCRDSIVSNKTGLLVPVRNINYLVIAIRKLLDNRKMCLSMGEAGRRLAEEKFNVKEVVEKHMEIYKNLIHS